MLALPPKMSIETLLAAAKFIEENDKQRRNSPPPAPPTTMTPAAAQPTAPQRPALIAGAQQHQQMAHAPQQLHIQAAAAAAAPAPTPAVVLHQVVQQAAQPFQHVTIQPTNGHIITAAPVNAIRIQKKDVNASINRLTVMNSFDLINPAVIDQSSGEVKRKQPPIAFRTGTREVHNKLEKNRRAHLKDCFDELNATLANARGGAADTAAAAKKTSNLNILDSALQCIKDLEKEADANAWEIERLAKEKIGLQQRFTTLRRDIKSAFNVDVPDVLRREDSSRKRHRHYEKPPTAKQPPPPPPLPPPVQVKQEESTAPRIKQEPPETTALTTVVPAATPVTTTMVAVAVDHTPLTTACTTIPAVIGGVLSLPATSISNGTGGGLVANNCIAGLATEEALHAGGGGTTTVAGIVTAATAAATPQPTAAYTFGIHQLPVAAANGGLVLQKVLVPKALTAGVADAAGHHPHHQLTAQFVSAHHHHHHHLPAVVGGVGGGDSKVIVNAQYVVKPLVVVSTASRPS